MVNGGGGGFMSGAMKSFKSNRALLIKERGAFDIKKIREFKGKPFAEYKKFRFKRASHSYLRKIREATKQDQLNSLLKKVALLLVSIILTVWGFIWLNNQLFQLFY